MTELFDAIAAIPSLLRVVKWLAEEVRQAEIRTVEAQMQKAIAETQATKDTSTVDKLFNPDQK